jgi:hypothetical protein
MVVIDNTEKPDPVVSFEAEMQTTIRQIINK